MKGPNADINPEPVLIREIGHVLVITLNRPHVHNAVDGAVCRLVGDALERAQEDRNIRTVVLTGSGDATFCAGADLKAIARGEPVLPPGREGWGLAGVVSHPISKPTIAAVNGNAVGGGFEIAMSCDLVVSARHALFGLPEVTRGRIAGAGGAFRVVEQVPSKIGMELLLTGESVSASRAAALGLVNRVVDRGAALDEALRMADVIAGNAPLAVQATKRIATAMRNGVLAGEVDRWSDTRREVAALRGSLDAAEGALAFVEKRAPVWRAE
jgi:crotonobetainyl-CoA hydratase